MNSRILLSLITALLCMPAGHAQENPWVVYAGGINAPGKGKHIVLVSGDEEYRSEEALPQLGKILAKQHGFKCTVLFAIDPKTGDINPNVSNIPGLEALKSADLMIIATRYRRLPDEQMQHIVDYFEAGKPIIGMRTATHAFQGIKGQFAKYNDSSKEKAYEGGFGRQVLGERWISHHGSHGSQSTRGILNKDEAKHPILTGLKDGDIWGPTDVYGANPLKPATILVYGQVLTGRKPTNEPLPDKKNDPMMPIAWTRDYKGGRIFTTTMGASQDLAAAGTRRMLVNAAYWCVGLEKEISPRLNVDVVGDYQPTRFGFNGFKKGVRPSQLQMK
jgi:type 1 glutamine amidotransferase